MSEWDWAYEGYDPDAELLREVLCATGNGYVCTRAAAPECDDDGIHYPGTYGAGVFNRLVSEVSGHEVSNEDMVNLPNWLPFTFRIEDGPWFCVDDVELLEHTQRLDLRDAVLTRRLRYRDDHGHTTTVTQRRLVSMDFEHAAALQTTFVAEDWSGRLEVRSGLDGTVRNNLVARYRQLEGDHLDVVDTREVGDDSVLLVAETNQTHLRIAMAARLNVLTGGASSDSNSLDGDPDAPVMAVLRRDGWIGRTVELDVATGVPVTVDKVVTIFTSRDRAISEPAEEAERWLARLGGFDDLLADHHRAWARLWERFHISGEGTDPEVVRIARLHIVQVLHTVAANRADLDVGIPARGLHGEAYRGHLFWDDMFVQPMLNLRTPELSRSGVMYRFRRLPEARAAAAEAGYRGAMFPWQSGSDGREENQTLHLNPESGRWVPDATHRQRHVGLAIAACVWRYYEATEDRRFLTEHGAELLVEIARFFASLASYDRSKDRWIITGVMGPDEFHTRYPGAEEPGLANNAYTNVLAAWVLARAGDALGLLAPRRRDELTSALGLTPDEIEHWEVLTERLFVPFHDGVISQFEGYEHLIELDWDDYRRRYDDIHRLDRILEAEGESIDRYRASKQADVLMLLYVFSVDELREVLDRLDYELDDETLVRTVDHYLARSSHGSTLSALVHAWVLARIRPERAMELFDLALRSDVEDVQGGTTHEGIHLASMAGTIDVLQRGFGGVSVAGDRLRIDPVWPESLGTMEFALTFRQHPLRVRVATTEVQVCAEPDAKGSIVVECRGETAEIAAGESVTFSLDRPPDPAGA